MLLLSSAGRETGLRAVEVAGLAMCLTFVLEGGLAAVVAVLGALVSASNVLLVALHSTINCRPSFGALAGSVAANSVTRAVIGAHANLTVDSFPAGLAAACAIQAASMCRASLGTVTVQTVKTTESLITQAAITWNAHSIAIAVIWANLGRAVDASPAQSAAAFTLDAVAISGASI